MGDLKYTWLSKIDPAWAPIEQECKDRFSAFWGLPAERLQEVWRSQALVMPEGTPMDLEIEYREIPLRDGHLAEIKIYKNTEKLKELGEKGRKVPMMLTAHGGGWMVGDHTVEEGVNRYTAKETGAVVVSVDYRLSVSPGGFKDSCSFHVALTRSLELQGTAILSSSRITTTRSSG